MSIPRTIARLVEAGHEDLAEQLIAASGSSSYGHKCKALKSGMYEISWTVDFKSGRLRMPKKRSSITDAAGAKRFCKKWKLDFPDPIK